MSHQVRPCIFIPLLIGCLIENDTVRILCTLTKLVELTGTQCCTKVCYSTSHFTYHTCGSCLIVKGTCGKGHVFNWCSSDVVENAKGSRILLDNLLVASNIVLSCNNYFKICLLCNFTNLPLISLTTFHAYQRLYICPGIHKYYETQQVTKMLFN